MLLPNNKLNKLSTNDFRENDVKLLNTLLKEIETAFSNDLYSYDYEMANERTYLVIEFDKLRKSSLLTFKNYLKNKPFLLLEKNNSIEIHIKNK